MRTKKERKKLVEDLVDTFEDRNELHKVYKARVKIMIRDAIECFSKFLMSSGGEHWDSATTHRNLDLFVDRFVESRFKKVDRLFTTEKSRPSELIY